MERYIERLMRCGYAYAKARQLCIDFVANLSLFDLECFVWSQEYVEEV